jgi:hypothetical protein
MHREVPDENTASVYASPDPFGQQPGARRAVSNTFTRSRPLEEILASRGFRAGFSDVRAGRPWQPERELVARGHRFEWLYEWGRLFAMTAEAQPFARIPPRHEIPFAMIEAYLTAKRAGAFPIHRKRRERGAP